MALNDDISSIVLNDESTLPDVSDSSDAPSLPSLSIHGQIMSNQQPKMPLDIVSMTGISGNNPSNGTHFMTMKEYDAKLNELKRENFQLKLTIYLAEKEKTGVTKPECESAISKELIKREKTIKAYQKIVQDKEKEIHDLKCSYQSKIKEKDNEIACLLSERETLNKELSETSSICRLLMSHLEEFVQYWKHVFPQDDTTPNEISSLLNSSVDLLNSASILISNENGSGEQSFQRNSFYKPNYNVLASVTGNQVFEMGPSFLGDGLSHFYSQQLQTPFNQPNFCGMSSDSDDVWSEPDRDVSRARIGLDDTSFVPIFRNNKPKTKRYKRRISVGTATGMSSLGLLPDMSQLIDKSHIQQIQEQKMINEHKFVQTELTDSDLNKILVLFNRTMNKQVVHASTQCQTLLSTKNTQTELNYKENFDSACQTSQLNINLNDEENQNLLRKLESMKIEKMKMKKAITKQVHKADKLIQKINLKDT